MRLVRFELQQFWYKVCLACAQSVIIGVVLTAVVGLQGSYLKDGVHVELGWTHGCEVCLHAATDDLTSGENNKPRQQSRGFRGGPASVSRRCTICAHPSTSLVIPLYNPQLPNHHCAFKYSTSKAWYKHMTATSTCTACPGTACNCMQAAWPSASSISGGRGTHLSSRKPDISIAPQKLTCGNNRKRPASQLDPCTAVHPAFSVAAFPMDKDYTAVNLILK